MNAMETWMVGDVFIVADLPTPVSSRFVFPRQLDSAQVSLLQIARAHALPTLLSFSTTLEV